MNGATHALLTFVPSFVPYAHAAPFHAAVRLGNEFTQYPVAVESCIDLFNNFNTFMRRKPSMRQALAHQQVKPGRNGREFYQGPA
jgi:hypothetical protein